MVKTTLTPDKKDIVITIPENYIGKKMELIYYTLEEALEDIPTKKHSIANLRGKLNLTNQEYNDFQKYVKDSRDEWNDNI